MSEYDLLLGQPEIKTDCIGMVFKASVTQYPTSKGFAFTTRFNKLKKMSCKGCEKCGSLEDIIGEFICTNSTILGLNKIQNNKLYEFKICNIYRDYETGYVEDYDLEIVEYKPPKEDEEKCQPEDK